MPADRATGNERREWIVAFAIFLALFHVCYWTKPGVFESEDFIKFYQPNLHFLVHSLGQGEIPWWNPYIGLGRPFVSDLQNAVFYPPTYLFCFGMKAGLYLLLCLHLFAALLGMRLLVRALGATGLVAWMAGFVLVFSGPFAALLFLGMVYYVCGLCFLPWLMWLALRLGREWSARRVAALGGVLGLQFLTGHPQPFWIGLVGTGLFVLVWKLVEREHRNLRGVGMPLGQLLAGVGLAAALTAVAWLPFLDLVAEGNRSGATVEQAGFGTSRLMYLFSFFCIPPYQIIVNSAGNWFVGAVWTVAGLAGWCTTRDARIRALIVVGLFALIFSFGTKSFVYGLCFELLPGTSMFRFPIRMAVWLPFALLVGGAVFLGRKQWSTKELAIAGAVVFVLLVARWCGEEGPQPVWQAIGFLVGGGALAFFRSRWPWGLALWMAIELLTTNAFYRRGYSMEGRYGVSSFAAAGQIKEFLANRPADLPPPRACLPPMVVPRNFGMLLGYANFDAYTSLFLRRPWNALHEAAGADGEDVLNTTLNDQIYRHGPFGIPSVSIDFGVDPQQQRLVVNPNPYPRAHLASTNGLIPVPIRHFAASELRLGFVSPEPATLVLNEAWFPGWTAVVNGIETKVEPVNRWMRGIPVGRGEQEVVLTFRPRHIGLGAVVSVLAMLGVGLGLRRECLSRRDREHPSGGSPGPGSDT